MSIRDWQLIKKHIKDFDGFYIPNDALSSINSLEAGKAYFMKASSYELLSSSFSIWFSYMIYEIVNLILMTRYNTFSGNKKIIYYVTSLIALIFISCQSNTINLNSKNELVKVGVTLLLTTQYLEEADHLADEIAVIDHGRVIARGTSDTLKKQVGGERLEIVVENQHMGATREIVAKVSGGAINVDEGLRQISAPVTTGSKALIEAAKLLDEKGIHPLDIGLKRPSLDDVFLSLTGHVAEEKKDEDLASTGKKRGR